MFVWSRREKDICLPPLLPSNKKGKKKKKRVDKGWVSVEILIFFSWLMQFAGGFDAETMHAFEELRNLAHLLHKK